MSLNSSVAGALPRSNPMARLHWTRVTSVQHRHALARRVQKHCFRIAVAVAAWQCSNIAQPSGSQLIVAVPCCVVPYCLPASCPSINCVPAARPQLEHLKAYHLNQALCSPAVQSCARVVARVAHVALSEASKLELDFPQRSGVPAFALPVLQSPPGDTPNLSCHIPADCAAPLPASVSGCEAWSLRCVFRGRISCDMGRAKRESSWVTWAVDAAMQGGKARSADFAIPGSAVKWCVCVARDCSRCLLRWQRFAAACNRTYFRA
jgi:hypothetical protein